MKKSITQNRSISFHIYFSAFQMVTVVLLSIECMFCMLSAVQAEAADIAVETFTDQSWRTGSGWSEAWYHEGSADIISTGGSQKYAMSWEEQYN